jgi:hypothetical protein
MRKEVVAAYLIVTYVKKFRRIKKTSITLFCVKKEFQPNLSASITRHVLTSEAVCCYIFFNNPGNQDTNKRTQVQKKEGQFTYNVT